MKGLKNMKKSECKIIMVEYKKTVNNVLSLVGGYEEKRCLGNLMDKLGLTDEKFITENECIIEYYGYNYIVKEQFKLLYESFKKYGYHIILDMDSIEDLFENLQYEMTEEERKCNAARINNIKINIK